MTSSHRRNAILIALALVAHAATGRAQSAAERELLDLQQTRLDAAIARDVATLDRMAADELRYCHTTGAVETKASYLEMVRTGRIGWREIVPSGMVARVYGDVGVIAGELQQTITVGNRPEPIAMRIRTIEVYVKRDGRWQMTEFQASRMAD